MHSRRKFLMTGGLATTAFIAVNPFKSIASVASPLLPGINSTNSIMLLHTSSKYNRAVNTVAKLKRQHSNAVVLNAHDNTLLQDASFDAMLPIESYKIIFKGNIKIGVISTNNNSVSELNVLAGFLKKNKNCQLVVCLSQLGFQNKPKPHTHDDIHLAQQSENIDVIISTATADVAVYPTIMLNKNQQEVIINPTSDMATLGKIDISFDNKGRKNNISFGNIAAA